MIALVISTHFVVMILSILCGWKLMICQGQLQFSLRINKAINCDMAGLKWTVEEVSAYYHFPKTYLYTRYNVTEDIKKINKLYVHLERCNEQGYDCEDFQNYRIDRPCQLLRLKNQAWSEYMNRFYPPFRCPIKKAIYEVQNATVDIDALLQWFPDMAKYVWKSLFKLTNEQDKIVFCFSFDTHMYQFRSQDRKPSRKPRSGKQ